MRKKHARLTIPGDVATVAYIAGLFDGEGSVSINATGPHAYAGTVNVSHRLIVNISNNNEPIIRWLHETLGGGQFCTNHQRLSPKLNHRWVAQGENARDFLKAVAPYVRIKAERVTLALEFLDLVLNRDTRHAGLLGAVPISEADIVARETFRQRMLQLNDRHVHKMAARILRMAFNKFPRTLYHDGDNGLESVAVKDQDTEDAYLARGWRKHPDANSPFAQTDPAPPTERSVSTYAFLEFPKSLSKKGKDGDADQTKVVQNAAEQAVAESQGWAAPDAAPPLEIATDGNLVTATVKKSKPFPGTAK